MYHRDRGGCSGLPGESRISRPTVTCRSTCRSSIVLFLDEVLNKVLQEGGEQQEVFEFW